MPGCRHHLVDGGQTGDRYIGPPPGGGMLAEGEASVRPLLASPKSPGKSLRFVSARSAKRTIYDESRLVSRHIIEPDRNNFTLLRLVAALAVLVSHALFLRAGTRADEFVGTTVYNLLDHAVNVFFVLSGLTVAARLARCRNSIDFILARALRPGFYLKDARVLEYMVKTLSLSTGAAALALGREAGSPAPCKRGRIPCGSLRGRVAGGDNEVFARQPRSAAADDHAALRAYGGSASNYPTSGSNAASPRLARKAGSCRTPLSRPEALDASSGRGRSVLILYCTGIAISFPASLRARANLSIDLSN